MLPLLLPHEGLPFNDSMNPRLYVGNVSPTVTEESLRSLFSKAGAVSSVELAFDPVSGERRAFAYVTMATPQSAEIAVRDLHSAELGGRHITVTEARPPSEPKGLMSEGFDLPNAKPFRTETARKQNRPPSGRRKMRSVEAGHNRRRRS